MPEKRRMSEQQRTREAERQKARRLSLSQATDPDSIARRETLRARATDRQRRRRETVAAASNADGTSQRQTQLERSRDLQRIRRARRRAPEVSTDNSSFLPIHQQEAIHDYLDRILRVRDDVGLCLTCLEKYHGMHIHGTQCDWCHREVRFDTVFIPNLKLINVLLQRGGHRYGVENDADPGEIPEDLRGILDDLTQMEEMLCSLASPCFLMWVSKGGQYKTRGNVITFPQDITHLCTTLPRLPEHLDVLLVRKPDARTANGYKDFRVRKHKVLAFLRYLKEHNPYYADVVIRPSEQVDLPVDGDIVDRLPHVDTSSMSVQPKETESSLHPSSEESSTFEPDVLSEEENAFIPHFFPRTYEIDAIRDGITQVGLRTDEEEAVPWPPFGPALSEYTTEGLFTMAFPSLFPFGKADYSAPRRHRLQLYEWAKHLIRYRDDRFATHPRFRFFALNLIFRHRAMSRGKFLFSRNVGSRNMTVGDLKRSLSGNGGTELAEKIIRCIKTVRGTRPYWSLEGAKLRDMLNQIGTPTFFYTLSMADMSWPDLHKLMPEDPFVPGLTVSQSYDIRARNVANNPHIVASYLSTRHRHLRDTILQHLGVHDNSTVEDYWFRVEWQSRGSGVCLPFPCTCTLLLTCLQGTFTVSFG